MKIERHYRNTAVPASALKAVRDFVSGPASASLGEQWDFTRREYRLFYENETALCDGWDKVQTVLGRNRDTLRHSLRYESRTGRLLRIDATDSTKIVMEAENGERTLRFVEHIEQLLHLTLLPRRVFLSHGRTSLWTRVQSFIEKEMYLNLEAIEFEQRPKGGRFTAQKLQEESERCSYAVIVVTGDDLDDEGEPHMRENVMHEIGFFQGRYGFRRVCLLREDGVTIPSNLDGFQYEKFPKGDVNSALVGLQRELREAFPLK